MTDKNEMPEEVYVSDGKYQLLVYKRPADPIKGGYSYPRVKFIRHDHPALVRLLQTIGSIAYRPIGGKIEDYQCSARMQEDAKNAHAELRKIVVGE